MRTMVGRGAVAAHGWYGLENYSRKRFLRCLELWTCYPLPPGFQKVHLLLLEVDAGVGETRDFENC